MSFLTELIHMLSSIESDEIAIHDERCISVRNRNAECIRCVRVCTSKALSYENNVLSVKPERCIGCGTCATACPTSAIEIKKPSDDELTKMLKSALIASKGNPIISCERALAKHDESSCDRNQMCIVACLGRIDESALVGLGAYKAKSVTLLCGNCETCDHAPGGQMIREVIPSAQNMLEVFGSPLKLSLTQDIPEHACVTSSNASSTQNQGVSRRELFTFAKKGSMKVASEVIDHKASEILGAEEFISPAFKKINKEGTLSHFVPTRRTRVYNYLKHVGEPVAETVETRIIGSLSIDADRCSSCRMCAVFCPTGAIEKVDGKDLFGIKHRPSICMQCRLCENICPEEAISISGIVPIQQFLGKKALCFEMKKPKWTSNRPSSMYEKVHSVIGDDVQMCSF